MVVAPIGGINLQPEQKIYLSCKLFNVVGQHL